MVRRRGDSGILYGVMRSDLLKPRQTKSPRFREASWQILEINNQHEPQLLPEHRKTSCGNGCHLALC
jgi:hypothetical protein